MSATEWTYKTARELRKALRAKKVSALELARDAIARIEAEDGRINAMCVRDFEGALKAARAQDRAIAKRKAGPLAGKQFGRMNPTRSRWHDQQPLVF